MVKMISLNFTPDLKDLFNTGTFLQKAAKIGQVKGQAANQAPKKTVRSKAICHWSDTTTWGLNEHLTLNNP